jgi:hypothetical protein
MKIYTFGCSWTYGCKGWNYNVASWVEKLAEKYPNNEVIDFSYPGTSLECSLFHFEKVLKEKEEKDKTVFQFTTPFRYTAWPDEVFNSPKLRYKKTKNYTKFIPELKDKIDRYHPSADNAGNGINKDMKFHKIFYRKHNKELELSKFDALATYIHSKSDYAFFQRRDYPVATHVPAINTIIGEDAYQSYVWDQGQHFDDAGCDWQASYIAKEIGLS